MYDDLARAQRPSALEWLVVNALIPSVLLTCALHWPYRSREPAPMATGNARLLVPVAADQPDAFPVLIRMPEPVYPKLLRRAGAEDRVLLRALVTADGGVDSASIVAVEAIHPAFVTSAQQALSHARFRPARFGGRASAAWITIMIDFTLTRAAT